MMTELRWIPCEEVKIVVPLVAGYIEESLLDEPIDVASNTKGFLERSATLMDLGFMCVLVAEEDGAAVGCAGFALAPNLWTGEVEATELFWYARPGVRGVGTALIRRAEEDLPKFGATKIRMSCLETWKPEALAKFYTRRGYRATERSFQKRLVEVN